ncbi:MAG TPA: thioredoxin-dependent thiol peroxidase [Haliangium sp.]|nr:thioredoxin-dependent thiol peroxidase [Haliangium sp.]
MLQEGTKAPAFRLPASTGDTVNLSDYAGKIVVLYVYPKDATPGCTTEAREFQAALPELHALGAEVLGVSKDSIDSHCKFADKLGLSFPLLSDPDGQVIEKYGAWGEKHMYGRTTTGIVRTTVVIGKDGRVVKVFPKVRVKGHVEKVLAVVRELSGSSS